MSKTQVIIDLPDGYTVDYVFARGYKRPEDLAGRCLYPVGFPRPVDAMPPIGDGHLDMLNNAQLLVLSGRVEVELARRVAAKARVNAPAAHAEPARERWEYRLQPLGSGPADVSREANDRGRDGWEMAGIWNGYAWFKRRLP